MLLFNFTPAPSEARIGLISDGMNALGDILSLNDKNAKHIARIQAVSAGVSAFSAAQSSFEQTAKIKWGYSFCLSNWSPMQLKTVPMNAVEFSESSCDIFSGPSYCKMGDRS